MNMSDGLAAACDGLCGRLSRNVGAVASHYVVNRRQRLPAFDPDRVPAGGVRPVAVSSAMPSPSKSPRTRARSGDLPDKLCIMGTTWARHLA